MWPDYTLRCTPPRPALAAAGRPSPSIRDLAGGCLCAAACLGWLLALPGWVGPSLVVTLVGLVGVLLVDGTSPKRSAVEPSGIGVASVAYDWGSSDGGGA